MVAWQKDEAIKRWLAEDSWRTEKLPAWLQSRWIEAKSLPSRPLAQDQIKAAVQQEIACFQRCFGRSPKVVVPPTFVWNEAVERAYAEVGVEVLITPGRRYPGRDRQGKLMPADRVFVNGEKLSSGLIALVRDVYFEPALGHDPKRVLEQVVRKWHRREPALLETHRFNFLDGKLLSSLQALRSLLEQALTRFPKLCFLSSHELAVQLADWSLASLLAQPQVLWQRLRR